MTAPLGERVLDWMLRRLHQAVRLEHDLVLVHACAALVDVGPSIDVRGEPWRVARVTGELTLRDALPEADRLLAIVPASFPPLPMDIAGRTYLRRILDVRAEDVVAGASGRFCEALVDEGLTQAVFDSLEHLRDTAGGWSLGELVTAREVRSVLVGAELGAARLDRERDWELLARWVREGAPTFRAPTLVRSALEEAQPRSGVWLGWALTDGSLDLLCTAGALLASAEGESRAPTIPGLAASDRGQLVELVDAALREVWRTAPGRAREVLGEAERIARQTELDASRHRLLRVPLEGALSRAANLAAQGHPPDDVEIEGLKRNLHAGELEESIQVVGDLARLARFQGLPIPADTKPAVEWFGHALRDVAWADMAFRRVRRAVETIPPWLADAAQRVIGTWLTRRDLLNQRFAESLANLLASAVLLSREVMERELRGYQREGLGWLRSVDRAGQRVFLVVLDGCDVASFLEILESLPPEERVGLVLPDVHDAVLRDDLTATGALAVAISPLPTVTSHSRRALFAGEIPGNTALDDTESAAANATADHRAWSRNTALGDLPRRLFLKGDLGPAGQPLLDALRANDSRVVAAVFNGVDDALSSKQTTALPRWSLGNLGAGAAEAIRAAVDAGWCIIVTADHGHTPFVTQERKAGSGGLGHRFSAEACSGSVEFRSGPLPRQPLHLLVGFGAWLGTQHRGFHGGAGLEEVAVPLAFLGRVRGEQEGRPRAPSWWWSVDGDVPPEQRPQAAPRPEPQPHSTSSQQGGTSREVKLDPRLDTLTTEEKLVVALLQKNESVRLSLIAKHLNKSPMRASGFMQQLVRKLFELRYPCITAEVLPDNDRLYRYEPVDRGPE